MRGTRFWMMAVALAMGATACRLDAGGNHNADQVKEGGGANAPTSGPDAAAAGTQITPGPPPVGTVEPAPADTSKAPSTPATAAPTDTGRLPEGNAPGGSQGTQPQKGP